MSHQSVPLAYAMPDHHSFAAPVRWTLLIWTSLVLIRHGLYWSMIGLQSLGWVRFSGSFNVTAIPTNFAMVAFAFEAVGLSMILIGAIDRRGRSDSLRRLGVGSFLVGLGLLITIATIGFTWINRSNPISIRVVMTSLWQMASAVAASSPVVLAWLSWRQWRSAFNRSTT